MRKEYVEWPRVTNDNTETANRKHESTGHRLG
jgi:hypothetical protein